MFLDDNIRRLHNEELIDLLFTLEDKVPRNVVDELISRGSEVVPILAEIVMDRILWMAEPPEWWVPIHATYILGAIGGDEVLVPLLSALRWADAYDNEWITEDLPSVLGSLGNISFQPLCAICDDRSAGWSARSIAMDALGSHAIRFPEKEEEVIKIMKRILRDKSEEHGAHRSAAYVLLDFRRTDCRRDLIEFAKIEHARQQQYPEYRVAFTPEEVEKELSLPRQNLEVYVRDWLLFYSTDEILRRQEAWHNDNKRSRPDSSPPPVVGDRNSVVIGRNDSCPCGSGKSYKRCCWKKLH